MLILLVDQWQISWHDFKKIRGKIEKLALMIRMINHKVSSFDDVNDTLVYISAKSKGNIPVFH